MFYSKLSDTSKGLLLLALGLVLLLQALGLFAPTLRIIVIIASLLLIAKGLMLSQLHTRIAAFFGKGHKTHKD